MMYTAEVAVCTESYIITVIITTIFAIITILLLLLLWAG